MRSIITNQRNVSYTLSTFFFMVLVIVSGMVFAPLSASAHSLYIQSGRYHVEKSKISPLFFCYGHHFPVDDGVRRKKLQYVRAIGPDGQSNDVELREGRSLHSYGIKYEQDGTYALVAETSPGYFSMYIDKKGRKRHSLKPLHTFIANAQSVERSMRSSQWTKTYVTSGEASSVFPSQVGLPLELLPEVDPSTLKMGDMLTLKIYNEGELYTGEGFWDATYEGFSTESEDMYIQKTRVQGGNFNVPIDASGRWFVRFYTKQQVTSEELKKDYLTEKRTTTLTFRVRNERKRPRIDSH